MGVKMESGAQGPCEHGGGGGGGVGVKMGSGAQGPCEHGGASGCKDGEWREHMRAPCRLKGG